MYATFDCRARRADCRVEDDHSVGERAVDRAEGSCIPNCVCREGLNAADDDDGRIPNGGCRREGLRAADEGLRAAAADEGRICAGEGAIDRSGEALGGDNLRCRAFERCTGEDLGLPSEGPKASFFATLFDFSRRGHSIRGYSIVWVIVLVVP